MPLLLPFLVILAFLQDLKPIFQDRETRALLFWMLLLLVIGTIFYAYYEGWTILDALYFCVITLATVGYGDLSPTTPLARLFTIFYVLIGISFFIAFVNQLAKKRLLIFGHRTGETDEGISKIQGEI